MYVLFDIRRQSQFTRIKWETLMTYVTHIHCIFMHINLKLIGKLSIRDGIYRRHHKNVHLLVEINIQFNLTISHSGYVLLIWMSSDSNVMIRLVRVGCNYGLIFTVNWESFFFLKTYVFINSSLLLHLSGSK